jgi:hypothetical protein
MLGMCSATELHLLPANSEDSSHPCPDIKKLLIHLGKKEGMRFGGLYGSRLCLAGWSVIPCVGMAGNGWPQMLVGTGKQDSPERTDKTELIFALYKEALKQREL